MVKGRPHHDFAPWQVWWADLDPQMGHEQAGRRPTIIVGTPLACRLPNNLAIVVPLTTRDRGLPFHPPVTLAGTTSFAMTDQIRSISSQRLLSRHRDELSTEEISAIKVALRRMISVG